MNPEAKRTYVIGIALVIILGLLGGGYWYYRKSQQAKQRAADVDAALQSVNTAPISNLPIVSNPVEGKIPDLNPADKTNPFKYNNPFD